MDKKKFFIFKKSQAKIERIGIGSIGVESQSERRREENEKKK